LGLELAEQLGWTLPDAIVYPTGGGTGLIGMWKAFGELARAGWIQGRPPRLYSVQGGGVRAPSSEGSRPGPTLAAPWPRPTDDRCRAAGSRPPWGIA